jgi:hypothetical protein
VPGIDPSIAVGVHPGDRRPYIGYGEGYILESPRHPFHRAMRRLSGNYDRRCRAPRALSGRARTTPLWAHRPLLLAGQGVRGELTMDEHSRFEGFDRHGIPYIEAGDRFRALISTCIGGPNADPGLRGLRWHMIVRIMRLA